VAGRPFRLTAPIPPEDDLHAAVAKALTFLLKPPAEWTTFPAGHVPLPAQFAVKLARLGLKRGWPDILILHGVAYGIELKRPGEQLSRTRLVRSRRGTLRQIEGQRDIFPRLEQAGMRIATCESVAEVIAALNRWGIPTRRIAA
jgi:hypothetical protein